MGWLLFVLGLVFLGWGYARSRKKLSPIPAYMMGAALVVFAILALSGLMDRQ